MNILGIIPARYASTRFPGKVLAEIKGKPMLQHVYERCSAVPEISKVVIATDHPEVKKVSKGFGAEVIMTLPEHPSGTDRCFEAYSNLDQAFDYVINIQGDEPLIDPRQISRIAGVLDGKTEIATLIKKIEHKEEIEDPGEAKVVFNTHHEALYFSRSVIPYDRDGNEAVTYFKHVGIYAYRSDILEALTRLPVSPLEKAESLEQLRWLENGFKIKVVETDIDAKCVETPEDLRKIEALM